MAKLVLVVAVACSFATASAGSYDPDAFDRYQNDAGSGWDAGDERSSATPVALGASFSGWTVPLDVDWYVADPSGTSPVCFQAAVDATKPAYAAFGVESQSSSTTYVLRPIPGASTVGGIAAVAAQAGTLRVAPVATTGSAGFLSYGFTLSSIAPPSAGQGDAGTALDAGSSPSSATPVAPGCLGGRLGGGLPLDLRDVFAVDVPAGSSIAYSFASVGALRLELLDAAGSAIGPALSPGEAATYTPTTGGIYYLSAEHLTGIGTSGYVVGIVVGPDPPGHGCRPACME